MIKRSLESINNCELCKNKPCVFACPLNNDIPSFIKEIEKENYKEAYKVLSKTTTLMSVCGRVCPHSKQCIGGCIKKNRVKIGTLEYTIGDEALKNDWKIRVPKETKNNVAIIGSGPAGLTCAYFLRKNGIGVTIYEKYDYLGGLLMHGVPDFRLPKDILKDVTDTIISYGIDVKYNTELGKDISLSSLKRKYDAIFIGIGANIPNKLHIEGEKLNGVYGGNKVLEEKINIDAEGKEVVVCGGGNVAMDTARTIKRMGAKKVTVIYRRDEKNMSASKEEYDDAVKEGIKFLFNTNIVKINGIKNVRSVSLVNTEITYNKGKQIIKNNMDSIYKIPCNIFISAIGSHAHNVVRKLKVGINNKGKIVIDKDGKTNIKKVFAGGDVAGVKSTIAWASRSGRNAAYAIIEYLEKENSK